MSGKQSPGQREKRETPERCPEENSDTLFTVPHGLYTCVGTEGYFPSTLVEDIYYFDINDSYSRAGWKRSHCCQKAGRRTRLITALDMTLNLTHRERVGSLNHSAGTRTIWKKVRAFEHI